MPVGKRSKTDMYHDVLDLLCKEGGRVGKASPTRVAHRANLPYDRFQKILEHLIKVDMVRRTDNGLLITGKGINCLRQLHRTNELLRRFGLDL
jgi:predicted transcriptional regulator